MERFGLMTFVIILTLGVLCRQYLSRALRLPYTVIMMLLGALTGLLLGNRENAFEENMKAWYNMSPHVLLYCFVPILVFESAFMTDTHIFSRQKWQIMTLAGPGVLVASILTGAFTKVAFQRFCSSIFVSMTVPWGQEATVRKPAPTTQDPSAEYRHPHDFCLSRLIRAR